MKKKKQIDRLTTWEWETLVAAWRYYEHGQTIASATFPSDIVERFWGYGNPYSDEVRNTIARQFAEVDHGLRGEEDWTDRNCFSHDCDVRAWVMFYQFCRGWCKGYATITASHGKRRETIKAFHVDFEDRWIPVDHYIQHPSRNGYIPKEYIKKIAVLLRTIDVLEGRQKLGKPKTEGAAQ